MTPGIWRTMCGITSASLRRRTAPVTTTSPSVDGDVEDVVVAGPGLLECDLLARLGGDLIVGARERPHEVGARDDADEAPAAVEDRQPVDAVRDHLPGGGRDRRVRHGRHRRGGHRLADESGVVLGLGLVATAVDQPSPRRTRSPARAAPWRARRPRTPRRSRCRQRRRPAVRRSLARRASARHPAATSPPSSWPRRTVITSETRIFGSSRTVRSHEASNDARARRPLESGKLLRTLRSDAAPMRGFRAAIPSASLRACSTSVSTPSASPAVTPEAATDLGSRAQWP